MLGMKRIGQREQEAFTRRSSYAVTTHPRLFILSTPHFRISMIFFTQQSPRYDENANNSEFSNKISKANEGIANIPSSVRVPQEDVTENPEFCT